MSTTTDMQIHDVTTNEQGESGGHHGKNLILGLSLGAAALALVIAAVAAVVVMRRRRASGLSKPEIELTTKA